MYSALGGVPIPTDENARTGILRPDMSKAWSGHTYFSRYCQNGHEMATQIHWVCIEAPIHRFSL